VSGGSLDYVYERVLAAADQIDPSTAERRAFITHLRLVGKALHDIEWVQSGDYGAGDETKPIMACIARADVIRQAVTDAELARERLNQAIADGRSELHRW
jgi:hypothetical protein